jgi:hypothetical protein
MDNGWISIHRKLLDWEWYSDKNTRILFLHCLLLANYQDNNHRGMTIKKGSFRTGRKKLSEGCGLTIQQTRTSLDKLISTSEITIESNTIFSVISITNWNEYQTTNHANNKPITNEQPANQQTDNKPITTNNNIINNKQINKQEKKKGKKPISKHIFIPPKNLNAKAWAEFEDHRKSENKKLSELAKTKNANIIKNFNHEEQQRIIDYSIGGGYTGLFANRRHPEKIKKQTLTAHQEVVQHQDERDRQAAETKMKDINPQPQAKLSDELFT